MASIANCNRLPEGKSSINHHISHIFPINHHIFLQYIYIYTLYIYIYLKYILNHPPIFMFISFSSHFSHVPHPPVTSPLCPPVRTWCSSTGPSASTRPWPKPRRWSATPGWRPPAASEAGHVAFRISLWGWWEPQRFWGDGEVIGLGQGWSKFYQYQVVYWDIYWDIYWDG